MFQQKSNENHNLLYRTEKHAAAGQGCKSSLPPAFINKVLLKHSHAHLFTHCPWLYSPYNEKLRDHSPLQGQITYYRIFSRKMLQTPHLHGPSLSLFSRSVMSNSGDSMDCSLPGSSVHGILQERILEWVAIPFSRGSSQPRNQTWVSCMAGRLFTD